MNKITFLGVWMTPDVGETVSFVIDLDTGARVLIDCGTNLVKSLLDNNIDPTTISHIVVTHSHGDHISGLPTYLFYRLMIAPGILGKKVPTLKIVATKSTIDNIKEYIRIPYGNLVDNSLLEYIDVNTECSYKVDDVEFGFFSSEHQPETIGFSTDISKKKIVYSSDTAISEKIIMCAKDADILIHDIVGTSKYGMLSGGHTLCNQISPLLSKYQVKNLYPVHRLPIYKDNVDEYISELQQGYSGKVNVPNDGDVIILG